MRAAQRQKPRKQVLRAGKGKTRVRRLKQIGQVVGELGTRTGVICDVVASTKMIHGQAFFFYVTEKRVADEKCCKLNKNRLSDL
jgi:hypothetical protein